MLTDTEIMLRVQAGDVGLYAVLVDRYRIRLNRFAQSKLNNASDAEDLVQETFLAAYHSRNSYSAEFAFSTWIWTIALNLSRKQFRRENREAAVQREFARNSVKQSNLENPVEVMLQAEKQDLLNEWLSQLPDYQSDAIRLKFFGGLRYEEIALAMDCSVSGAKRRVKVGLQKLFVIAEDD